MSTVTPILDTLVHQVLGRRAGMAQFRASRAQLPLLEIEPLQAGRKAASDATPHPEDGQQIKARAKQHGKAAGHVAARLASTADKGAARAGTAPQTTSAQLQLSREGQAIAMLLSRFGSAPMATSYTQGPLFNGPQPPAATMLAALLGRQVSYSGVFYESHLGKWLKGKRSLKQLKQEPQGKLKSSSNQSSKSDSSPRSASTQGQNQARNTSNPAATPRGPSLAASLSGQQRTAMSPIHETMLPVVRQQLDALSSSVFRWQGMAWPHAPMQWEIHRHGQEGGGSGSGDNQAEQTAPYSTRLKLELPTLGTLEVQIVLAANALQMFAWAGSEQGAEVLAPKAHDLQQRFEDAGFDTASVQFLADNNNG